jgi:hypothetical protein
MHFLYITHYCILLQRILKLLDVHDVSMIGPAFPTIEQHKKQPTPRDSLETVAFQLAVASPATINAR